MNFSELYQKIKSLDEGMSQGNMMPQATSAAPSSPTVPSDGDLSLGECGMEECGDMPMPHSAPSQQDSVTMTVSMNGSGKGGIRDLMNVLRNIEDKMDDKPPMEPDHGGEIVIGEPEVLDSIEPVKFEEPKLPEIEEPMDQPVDFSADDIVMGEEGDEKKDYANDPEIRKMSVASVIGIGDDLASKGKEAPKQAGGGNPWNINESSLVSKLARHYEEVKNRSITE